MQQARIPNPLPTTGPTIEKSTGAADSTSLKDALRGLDYDAQVRRLSPDGAKRSAGDGEQTGSAWAKVVRANFGTWDKDGDDTLTLEEAQARYASGADKGDDLAALKGVVRLMDELHALSKDNDGDRRRKIGMTKADLAVYEASYPTLPGHLEYLERGFANPSGKLGAESAEGFFGATGKPDYKLLQQGGFGTCYHLAALTSLAARDPNVIANMIQTVPGVPPERTKYIVTFPSAGSVTVVLDNEADRPREPSHQTARTQAR